MRRWHQRPEIGAAIFLGSSLPVALRAPVSTDPKKIAKHQTQSTLHQCRTPQKFTMSVPLTLRLECSVNAETPPLIGTAGIATSTSWFAATRSTWRRCPQLLRPTCRRRDCAWFPSQIAPAPRRYVSVMTFSWCLSMNFHPFARRLSGCLRYFFPCPTRRGSCHGTVRLTPPVPSGASRCAKRCTNGAGVGALRVTRFRPPTRNSREAGPGGVGASIARWSTCRSTSAPIYCQNRSPS